MTETQASICEWADATFGAPVSDASIAARALVEARELVEACTSEPRAATTRIGVEVADVFIVLTRIGRSLGMDVIAVAAESSRTTRKVNCFGVDFNARWAKSHIERLRARIQDERFPARHFLLEVLEALVQVAVAVDCDLPAAIDAKMCINRARKWRLDGNGHGQHVEEG